MRTYQDGTAVGGLVLGLKGCFGVVWGGIGPSIYTYQEKYVSPTYMGSGKGGTRGGEEPVGG